MIDWRIGRYLGLPKALSPNLQAYSAVFLALSAPRIEGLKELFKDSKLVIVGWLTTLQAKRRLLKLCKAEVSKRATAELRRSQSNLYNLKKSPRKGLDALQELTINRYYEDYRTVQ
jgi:hypothetical protein